MIYVEKITVNKTSIKLNPGEDYAGLSAVVSPDNATCKTVKWERLNTSVVVVNEMSGFLHARNVGQTRVIARAIDGSGVTKSISVTVARQPVEDITLNYSSVTLEVGDTRTLVATVSPSNAYNKDINWSSENTGIATVDDNGVVTAISAGSTTITATAADGSGVYDCCEVTVEVAIHEEMVSALRTKEDCYVRLDTIISNTTTNDTRLKQSSGSSVVLRSSTADTVQLLQNTKITDDNGEDWYQILYNGMITYVTADSFDVTTMPKPTFYAVKNMAVNTGDGSNLNVRNKPYITGDLIGKFTDQTIVQLVNSTPQNGNWYPVYGQLNNGNYSYGWCCGDYLTDENPSENNPSDGNATAMPDRASNNCLEFIIDYEGKNFWPTARDDGYGNLTIGYGHVVKSGESFGTITEEEALELFAQDISSTETMVKNYSNNRNKIWSQQEYDALVSLAYNAGTEVASVMDDIISGDDPYEAFPTICKADGKFSLGLWRRRMDEADIFVHGEYDREDRDLPIG